MAFYPAIMDLLASNPLPKVLLEIGPHSTLAGPLRQILDSSLAEASYIPTLIRAKPATESLLHTAGQLLLKGATLDLSAIIPRGRVRTDLPSYSWNHDTQYWHESRLSRSWRFRSFPHHDILGSRIFEAGNLEPMWRNILQMDKIPWVRDHVIGTDIVFPGTAYIAMACEAIRQETGTDECTLREVSIIAALILRDSETTEIILSMRPRRLTNTVDSRWYDFTISSCIGTSWTKHCIGQVQAGGSLSLYHEHGTIHPLPRKVVKSQWYETMSHIGWGYGPRFRVLENVSAHPLMNKVVAEIPELKAKSIEESAYFIHPADLDSFVQLLPAALARGLTRNFEKKFVPTYFEEVYIKKVCRPLMVEVTAGMKPNGTVEGNSRCNDRDGNSIHLKGVITRLLDDEEDTSKNSGKGTRLEWKPDVDLQNIGKLVTSIEGRDCLEKQVRELTLLYCIRALPLAKGLISARSPASLRHFVDWLDGEVSEASLETLAESRENVNLQAISADQLDELVAQNASRLRGGAFGSASAILSEAYAALRNTSGNLVDSIDILLPDELRARARGLSYGWNYTPLIQLLSHHTPHMCILEIDSGAGETTSNVLESLHSDLGERMFYSYTYTNASQAALDTVKAKLKHVDGMDFQFLDISEDLVDSPVMSNRGFDLIITTNMILTTSNRFNTLLNIRKLLKPKGRLLLQELCSGATTRFNFFMVCVFLWLLVL